MRGYELFFGASCIAILSLPAVSGDWPQWRGPQRNGVSQESGLLQQWPQGGPQLLWQLTDIGDGYATPAVAGDLVYVLGNRGMQNEFVRALSVRDGSVAWSTRLGNVGNPDQQPPYPMARSTPTVDEDRLYALSSDGDLASMDSRTGKVIWKRHLRRDFGGQPGKWAYAESPLIDGDALVVTPGGAQATLVALRKDSGTVIWKSAVPGGDAAAYSSAIVTEARGHRQYVQFLDKGVVGVDARTGDFLWRYEKTNTGPANIPTPIAHEGYVYSANARRFGGALVQLNPSGDGIQAEEVYFERDAPNTLGGQVLLNGFLYGTNSRGPACAEFLSGKVRWQVEELGPGAVVYADKRLYFHAENGEVALAEATPEGYREKGRFTPSSPPKRLRGPREMAWAYPVIADGRLYIRDLGTLWCYNIKR